MRIHWGLLMVLALLSVPLLAARSAPSVIVEERSITPATEGVKVLECRMFLAGGSELRAIDVRVGGASSSEQDLAMVLRPEAPYEGTRVFAPKARLNATGQLFAMIIPRGVPAASRPVDLGSLECELVEQASGGPVVSAKAVTVGGDMIELPVSYVALASHDIPGTRAMLSLSPNPATGAVDIRYAIPEPAQIDLAIFDPGGRRVRSILSGSHDPGQFLLVWDRRDDAGRPVPAGIYFSRLQTPRGSATAKVILLGAEGGTP